MRLCLTNLLLLLPFALFANVFTVTTNSNTGPASLREAITLANANVSSTDTIKFNIPDLSETGRTILLNSELPYITSNLTIDGTTQPGSAFGNSKAKIKVKPGTGYPTTLTSAIFFIWNQQSTGDAVNVSIFGMYITDTYVTGQNSRNGIRAIQSLNLKIGGIDKGNVISGFETGIYLSTASNRNALIEYNWIGLNANGGCSSIAETNGVSIKSDMTRDVVIQKNYIFSYSNSIDCVPYQPYARTITILNNNFGVDITGATISITSVVSSKRVITIDYTSLPFNLTSGDLYELKLKHNVIAGKADVGIFLRQNTAFYVLVDSNIIGTNAQLPDPGVLKLNRGIYVDETLVQPPTRMPVFKFTGNKIYYCNIGLSREKAQFVFISDNSFYCNQLGIASTNPPAGLKPVITSVTESSISGTSGVSSGVIEIYSMKDCGTSGCQGFKKIGKINPTSNNWNYCGYLEGKIVVTQFTGDGTTSDFSNCMQSLNNPVVGDANCSGDSGSITGIAIPPNATISWRNKNGMTVGSSSDLLNVPAGKYYYKVTGVCSYTSDTFEIKSAGSTMVDTSMLIVQHELCSGNGFIKNIKILSGSSIAWVDSLGNTISSDTNLLNVYGGAYRLVVGNGTCVYKTQWFHIQNSSPTLDTSRFVKASATCNKNNGTIAYVGNVNSTYSFVSKNDQNITVATGVIASALPAGTYTLQFIRDSASVICQVQYGPFTIVNAAGPSLDTSLVQLTHASCDNNNAAITNLRLQNTRSPVTFRWEDSAGKIVGTTLDLLNIPAGKYRFKLKDGNGCDTVTSSVFTIRNDGAIAIDTTQLAVKPVGCNLANGSISGIAVTGASNYQWMNIATGAIVASSLTLENIPVGSYRLLTTNNFGCKDSTTIINVGAASFLPVSVVSHDFKNAHCDSSNGYIRHFQFSTNATYTFRWADSVSGTYISNNAEINNLSAGTYQLYAKDSNNCEQRIFSETIYQIGKPTVNESLVVITNDRCDLETGSIVGLTASGGASPYRWSWINTAGTRIDSSRSITALRQGSYYAVVTDSFHCADTSALFQVVNHQLPVVTPVADDQLIFRGTATDIMIKNHQPNIYYLYDTLPAANIIASNTRGIFRTYPILYDKTFYLKAAIGTCFSNLVPVKVNVFDDTKIYVPNAFSPNRDGLNDTWRISLQGKLQLDYLQVFNRWGQEVFRTANTGFEWNGTYKDKPLPIGTYYWVLKGKDTFSKPIILKGYVVILQ
jgi:gliding motility-associated-like protein